MPFTVITLKKVPQALRGDLTKWMQEIATGVYIGNFNTKIREKLWERVKANVKEGEATISYSYRNELGYQFDTCNTNLYNIDVDGIPLVFIPDTQVGKENNEIKYGFSNAAKFRNTKKYASYKKKGDGKDFIVLDIETDGLDKEKNTIIEIGAIKSLKGEISEFQSFITCDHSLPANITKLTGISDKMLADRGEDMESVLRKLIDFIGDLDIIGYNVGFDLDFISSKLRKLGIENLRNKRYDLLRFVKNEKLFLANYKLQTVLKEYGINEELPHRALADAKLTYKLALKVNKFRDLYCGK